MFWRGVGLIARLEPLDYDREPDDQKRRQPRTTRSPGESSDPTC
jgi:hypothetical protein